MADMKAHKQQRQETTIPTTVPSPFGPTFTAPPQGLDHLPPLHSQCSRTYCSSSSTSHSCDCSRAEYKAQKKMLKAQAKTQKKESLWMAKEARHQAKEFKREAKHQAKQFKQEVRHQTKHAIKTARSNLRDRNYTYTGHYYPSNPSAPPLSLQVPQELRQIHSSGTVQPSKPTHSLDAYLAGIHEHCGRFEHGQQYKTNRKIRHDCNRYHRHHPSAPCGGFFGFGPHFVKSALERGLRLLGEPENRRAHSSSSSQPVMTITPASLPLPVFVPPSPMEQATKRDKQVGPQDPLLIYALSGMSLNDQASSPSPSTSPSSRLVAPVMMATARPDLEIMSEQNEEDLSTDMPPPPYEAATGRATRS